MRSMWTSIAASLWIGIAGCAAPPIPDETVADRPAPTAEPAQGETWTPSLQLEVRRLASPKLSPSGEQVVFEVAHADLETDRWAPRLVLAPADGRGDSVPLDRCASCRDAQWGPGDDSLFVRAPDEKERERVHAFELATGAKRPITPEDSPVGWYQASPTGTWVAYTTRDEDSENPARWTLQAVAVADGRIVRWDLPGSVAGFSWAPGGDRLVTAYQPTDNLDWRQKALAMLELESGTWTALRTGPGAAWLPRFGPRGRRIAFVASPGAATWMMDSELRVLDLEHGTLSTLAPTPDRNVDLLAWHPSGDSLLGTEYEGSTRRLVSVPLDGGPARYVGPDDRSIRQPHVSDRRITFTSERWNEPQEVFVAELPEFRMRQISSVQPAPAAPLGRTLMTRWTSDDGVEVEGLLTYPVGYEDGTRVPLLVRLHGGPPFPAADGYLGATFMTAYPLASMASAGFAILQPNFRGSAGYGRQFRHELHDEWGSQDYRDVMAGVDALVARGIADPDRLGVMGWSYGGYLTAWTITQSDRFAAASMGAAMTDLAAFDESTSLGGMLADWFGGPADDRAVRVRQRSPITHVQNVRRPVLIQHGTNDPRVPIAPVRTFAAALAESGIEHEVRTYDGGHGPWTPRAELAVLEQNLDWFVRILGDDRELDAEPSEPSAIARGELLVPRYGLSATTDGHWVYVYGGAPRGDRNGPDFMHQGLVSMIERVDPRTLESTYFSSGLHRRANHDSVVAWDALVSCGGRTQVGLSRFRLSSCEKLDFESGVFRALPELPEPLRTLGMAEVDTDLYAVGGLRQEGGYSSATLRLGRDETAWEPLDDLPFPREGPVVSVGRQLFALGGYNGSALRSTLVFDTETKTWVRRGDLPYPLSAFSAISDGTDIYLFGDYERMSAVHRYDPKTGRLELLDLEITPRRHADAVLVDGRVLVIGGNQASSGPATRVIESFTLDSLRTAPVRP
ncbi:MAG: prolyl oligopeptidase family serine peptidase [Acidobacteriota bacterium]